EAHHHAFIGLGDRLILQRRGVQHLIVKRIAASDDFGGHAVKLRDVEVLDHPGLRDADHIAPRQAGLISLGMDSRIPVYGSRVSPSCTTTSPDVAGSLCTVTVRYMGRI